VTLDPKRFELRKAEKMKSVKLLSIFYVPACLVFSAAATVGVLKAATTEQIALNRWYIANQVTQFPVGGGSPLTGALYDGSSIWVALAFENSVVKLRASDGAILGTFPVGPHPQLLAFDGSSIWATNSGGSTVSKLRASDGATLGTFSVGLNPCGIAFDGKNLWIANQNSHNVMKLNLNGSIAGTFTVGTTPTAVAFDGSAIWTANYGSNTLTKLALSGTVLGTFQVSTTGNTGLILNSLANPPSRSKGSQTPTPAAST
jgi:hypothetical protein